MNEEHDTPLKESQPTIGSSYEGIITKIELDIMMDQKRILGSHASKSSYFKSRNLSFPETEAERKSLADELSSEVFFRNDTDNTREVIFLLFRPFYDDFDDNWLHIIANIYDHESPLFKPHLATQLYMYSALINDGPLSAAAAYYMGFKYYRGHEREVDYGIASKWFELAVAKGNHPLAKIKLSTIYKNNDPRYRAIGHEDFTKRADSLLDDVMTPPTFYQKIIDTLLDGSNSQAQEKAVASFQALSTVPTTFRLLSHWHIAMRSMLGLSIPQDFSVVEKYLEILPNVEDATEGDILLVSQKKKLQEVVEKAKNPTFAEQYKQAAAAMCAWYTRNDRGQLLSSMIHKRPAYCLGHVRDMLWIASELADREQWNIKHQINWKLYQLQMQQANITYQELLHSTLTMGPRYNPQGFNGLPVLGAWEPPSSNAADAEQKMLQRGSYIPPSGVGLFKGLRTTPYGYIQFDCTQSGSQPALLFQEDFDVAMILAFANNDIIWPSFSCESADKKLTDNIDVFKVKIFDPEWMGHTDFGRTMYTTDIICGALAWSPKAFPLVKPNTEEQKQRNEQIKSFLHYVSLTGGRTTRAMASRLMLRTEHVHINGLDPAIKGDHVTWNMHIKNVKMRIDGSYVLEHTNGMKNKLIALNDSTYVQGAITQKLTDNYDYIASIMPVFERARQLMGLFYSLTELRKAGFEPNPQLLLDLQKKYKSYAMLPALPRKHIYAQALPHL